MKIKFLVSMNGTIDRAPGDVDVVSAKEGNSLIAHGFAEATVEPVGRIRDREIETAQASKLGVEYAGKRLFGAAAAAVRKKLAGN